MEINTENNILSEFENQRKQVFESNKPNNDFKIIQNIADSFNIDFTTALNIIDSQKTNITAKLYNKNAIPQFERLKKSAVDNKINVNDTEIIQGIANNLKLPLSELAGLIDSDKNEKLN